MILKNISYLILAAFAACAFGGNKPGSENKNADKPYITDSIDRYDNIMRSFGKDSIYLFTPAKVLSGIIYLDSLSVIHRITFKNGKKEYVEYNPQNEPDSLFCVYFDTITGAVYYRFWEKDSIIKDASGNSVYCNKYYEEYYPDGRIKATGQQGIFGAFGTSVGLSKEYDESGKLLSTTNYVYPPKALEETDTEYLTYLVECDYYDNGKPKWRKVYRNYVYYESDSDDQSRLGVWEYYNERGNIIKTEKYSRFNERTGENKPYK